ncbi:MAG: hypothetical protein NTV34_02505, partial [Proteobacteria bacterium]|nr:hypothetical protein [Pseudomonadota bacterium]
GGDWAARIDSLQGEESGAHFLGRPLYNPELGFICNRTRTQVFEITSGGENFILKYKVEDSGSRNIRCHHGMPISRIISGKLVQNPGASPEFPRFDIELLAIAEGVSESTLKPLAISRTLGSLRVRPDESKGSTTGRGEFRFFGGLFPKGVNVLYYESGGYELGNRDLITNSMEFQSIIIVE